MNRIDSEIWSKLESSSPAGEQLAARRALQDVTDRLYCAIDSSKTRHLLIHLRPEEDELQDNQSSGLAVDSRDMVVQGKTAAKYVDIECRDVSGYSILDLIGGEIADGLADEKRQPAELVKRVLTKWRRFWGQLPQQLLSKDEQIGLFAELWFLSVWLLPKFGSNILPTWRGPWGSRHDFEWSDKAVEVKATTSTRGRIHKIHGITQLEEPAAGPLFLFSSCLREETSAINSLPGMIEICRKQITDSDDALTRFESALVKVGYSPLFQDDYEKLKLQVVESALFHVKGDFPKITTTSFPLRMPPGIERIEYEINLNTFDHLIVSNNPDTYQLE
jgi:hypothetical protein